MAFESLSEKLSTAFKNLRRKGKLSEADVKAAMREIKMALLEADVNFKVVKEFVKSVSERCGGSEVMQSLTPAQQVIKIVNEELTSLMGSEVSKIKIASAPPTIIMMVGLQGTGKTTHCGKLAAHFKKQHKRPLLIACDVYRPAAVQQLQIVGQSVEVPVFSIEGSKDAVSIAKQGIEPAKKHGNDMVIIDTAGRLHIDEELMGELGRIQQTVQPHEVLLVVDAMTGQDAVNVAESFHNLLGLTGVILTKLDGDTRGGAALSVRHVTGHPIKFIGTGEKMDAIEPFYPDRMASRILGMGDVLTLIDKAQQVFDEEKAKEMEEKLRKKQFNLSDFLVQMRQIKEMGPIENLLGMMPGMSPAALKGANFAERQLGQIEAIILSMTPEEREKPDIINAKRKRRIALGSGTSVEAVNRLLKLFAQMNQLYKQMNSAKGAKRFGRMFGL